MTILLVRSDREERTRRAEAALSDRFPGEEVKVIERGEGIAAGGNVSTAGVFVPWPGRPWSLAPVAEALRRRRAGARIEWIDDEGTIGPCGVRFFLRECARLACFRMLDLAARLVARLLVAARAPDRIGGEHQEQREPGGGRLEIVLPILPDLSHTFIYREVLALLAASPGARVTCLQRGTRAPVHPEAEALLHRVAFLPRRGVFGRYASVFARLLLHPHRAGSLLALYARRPGGSTDDLFGKGPQNDPMHPGNAFALADSLERSPPAHLHVYSSTYPANVAMGAACLLGIPFSISSYVDFDFDYDFKMLAEKHRLARFFRVCTKFCTATLTRMLGLPPDDRSVPAIVYGLDLPNWQETARPPGRGVLVTASRIVPKKGLHLVPPALRRLADRGVDFTWHLAGDGPEEPLLRSLVEDLGLAQRVRFLGPLPNGAVKELLLRGDVAVLPCVVAPDGERDGIPIFLTEAMVCGVPVVSTPVSAVPEVVRHGDTGFLARTGDPESLADCLEQVLRDPGAARAVGLRGRQEMLATHDVSASASELLGLIARSGAGPQAESRGGRPGGAP